MIKAWKDYIKDPDRDIKDRLLVFVMTIITFVLVGLALLWIILGESLIHHLIIAGAFSVMFLLVYFSIKHEKARLCAHVIAFFSVYMLLPAVYFLAGGPEGGAPVWTVAVTLFLTLTLTGKWLYFFLISDFIMSCTCFYIAFTYPSQITVMTRELQYTNKFIAMLVVCMIVVLMVQFVGGVYKKNAAQLVEQKREIEELSAGQNRFFSSMSHEIRTPINTIIGLNEMILREDISDEVAEDAQSIQDASKMLLHTINDILDMSKIQAGQMQLTPAVYRTGDMLSGIVGMHWLKAKEKGITFKTIVAPDVPAELYGDEVRIKQVVINLLNNAIKYTEKGSVTLSIQCGKKEKETVNMIYSVEDTGMGIRKESIPHLFSAFRRVDETQNRFIEGTGLGLSIVKKLVDLMDGTITVNSVYTKGSSFTIELPQKLVSQEVIGNYDPERRSRTRTANGYHQIFEAPEANVLVVDDNTSNLMVVTKLLRDTKVQIDTASSGAEALEKTLSCAYHAIFMDHMMPGMDGIECLHRVREQVGGLCKETKVIAFTANAGNEEQELYRKEGFDGYVVKPVSGNALENELLRVLPQELVRYSGGQKEIVQDSMNWITEQKRKLPVVITTESIADVPQIFVDKYHIPVIAHRVKTEKGLFRDGTEVETRGILAYMEVEEHTVTPVPPSVEEMEAFFVEQLARANYVIHIVVSGKLKSTNYPAVVEAARAFDNVVVIDSEQLSSGQGFLVLEACMMAADGKNPFEIRDHIERIKGKIQTSFIVDNLDYLARSNQVGKKAASLIKSFMAHPVLYMKDGDLKLGKFRFGSGERACTTYINKVLQYSADIDDRRIIIAYTGISNKDLKTICSLVGRRVKFKEVIMQRVSPSLAASFGKEAIGLIFMKK